MAGCTRISWPPHGAAMQRWRRAVAVAAGGFVLCAPELRAAAAEVAETGGRSPALWGLSAGIVVATALLALAALRERRGRLAAETALADRTAEVEALDL